MIDDYPTVGSILIGSNVAVVMLVAWLVYLVWREGRATDLW